MGSSLDPVTGLPMVGVPDVVSQIPLGVQVVPWDDIKAVDRPQGGPAYPNDIIDTFAWVTGENVDQPGTVHAGTMTNDRRLRVESVSGGGEASDTGALWATAQPLGMSRFVLAPGQSEFSEYNTPRWFFGIWIDAGILDFGSVVGPGMQQQTVEFVIDGSNGILAIPLGGYFDGTFLHGTYTNGVLWMPPAPIDLELMGYNFRGNFSVTARNFTPFTVSTNIAPILSPT